MTFEAGHLLVSETGAVALRTVFPEVGPLSSQAWLVLDAAQGVFKSSGDVEGWAETVQTAAVDGATYTAGNGKYNAATQEVAVRTHAADDSAGTAWMVASVNRGTRFATTGDGVEGWPDITAKKTRKRVAK